MSEHAATNVFEVALTGCRPEPLASYLKAIGVLRVVAEQKDRDALGFWRGEHFVLRSSFDSDALVRFFLDDWKPTPVVAPWNGGSGFYPKDNHEAAAAIQASADPRMAPFGRAIELARDFIQARGWSERPEDQAKVLMLKAMRAQLPDEALAWLDAAVVIGDDRLLFPPLLGTGGNDGRLDFSNNYQQRVVEAIAGGSEASVRSALYGTTVTTRFKGTMGQYQPAAGERTNPWDFVLLIEGAVLFAGSATRRFENAPTTMAYPFHARAAGGASTVTDDDEDESRDELWLPLWSSPTTLRDIRRLFAEGRATVGAGDRARPASSALDFARAITGLGVDRGIDGFTRIGFHVRNGLAYFATPLGRFATREVRAARLLDDVDGWFGAFRRKAAGKSAPHGVAFTRRRLERAMFECATAGTLGSLLLALGDAERALGESLGFTVNAYLGPVPHLPPRWAEAIADGTVEQRLGAALASRPGMRARLVPVDDLCRSFDRSSSLKHVFTQRPLVDNLHALLMREDVEAQQQQRGSAAESDRLRCSLTDIARFIDGQVDDVLVERWARALVLVDGGLVPVVPADTLLPPALFAALSVVQHRHLGDDELPRTAGVLPRACAGDAVGASMPAIRRLNAAGRPLPIPAIVEPPLRTRRIAAALAFPLTRGQRRRLESMVLPTSDNATTAGPLQEQA